MVLKNYFQRLFSVPKGGVKNLIDKKLIDKKLIDENLQKSVKKGGMGI